MPWVLALEVDAFCSFALADKINILKKEKERSKPERQEYSGLNGRIW